MTRPTISFEKISFVTTKEEQLFLESMNLNHYHSDTRTEFMHKLIQHFMSLTNKGALVSSAYMPESLDSPNANHESRKSLELKLIGLFRDNADPLLIMNTLRQIDELDEKERSTIKTEHKVTGELVDDPNKCYKTMAECTRLIAESAENCARATRAHNGLWPTRIILPRG